MCIRDSGWSEPQLDHYVSRFGGFGRGVSQLPDAFVRRSDGERLDINGREWRVITGAGHSPEHVCLWCETLGVFISGDQILPRISSNVSVFPTEPQADPLADWLASCRKLQAMLPSDILVLPSHNEPFTGAHKRLEALVDGHELGMRRIIGRLERPMSAVELFGALFARRIDQDTLGMATGETIAHLNCLMGRGLVSSFVEGGRRLYARAA